MHSASRHLKAGFYEAEIAFLKTVMAGLGPAIHEKKLVDPRAKPGDDDERRRSNLSDAALTSDLQRSRRWGGERGELSRDLVGEDDTRGVDRQAGDAQSLGCPGIAGVTRIVAAGASIEDTLRMRACSDALRFFPGSLRQPV